MLPHDVIVAIGLLAQIIQPFPLSQFGVSLNSLNDPNLATWSWFNQAGSTVTTNGPTIVLQVPNSGANNLTGRTTPVAGASPYTATLGLVANVSRRDFGQCGLVITDGVNYEVLRWPKNGGDLDIFTWTGVGAPTTNLFSFTNQAFFPSPFTFIQVQEDSTNRFWRVGSDGSRFTLLFTELKQAFVVVSAVGFFCLNNTGSAQFNVSMTAVHWLVTTP